MLIERTQNDFITRDDNSVFQVRQQAFLDQEILAAERERIFDKCWLYVGHASEIPEPGSFLTRKVGGRELIFNRDATGTINAFLNTCPHRGGRVCREKAGSAKSFQCFYHGWVFGADGSLRHHPQADLYPEDFNERQETGLTPVAQAAGYRDFWFVCFDPSAMSLPEYLAGAKPYLDRLADQSAIGMKIVPGAQQFSVRANWKLWHENGMDPFHVPSVHASFFDYTGERSAAVKGKSDGEAFDGQVPERWNVNVEMESRYQQLLKSGQLKNINLGNGHVAYSSDSQHGRPFAVWDPSWGPEIKEDIDAAYAATVARVGEERAHFLAHQNAHLLIFPNLAIVDNFGIMIRTYYSDEPESMIVNSWTMAPQEEPLSLRRIRLYNYMEFLGPAGFGTPDDIEAIEQAQRGYHSVGGHTDRRNDLSGGMAPKNEAARASKGDEAKLRVFWSTWNTMMGFDED